MFIPSTKKGIGFTSERTQKRLVTRLKQKGIGNSEVLSAIGVIPRHLFIDEALATRAYEDTALPIGYQQTISQPFVVALMSEKLVSKKADRRRALEIGTGCGYQTAVLARLFERVFSIERIRPLSERAGKTLAGLEIDNVELLWADGIKGWRERAPFDAILLTAAPEVIPNLLLGQLSLDGRLVAPVGSRANQRIQTVVNRNGQLCEEAAEGVRFVPLVKGVSK